MRYIVGLAIVFSVATPALAWGDRGHRAIADIAWTQLTPAARRQVQALLAGSAALATPACPVGSFEDAATWADCVRSNYHDRYARTSSWHYVDVSICRPFQLPVDSNADFIVERYRLEIAVLVDRGRPPVERLEALLWVEHLVGDLHQPLHVADAGDRGGNQVEVAGGQGRYPLNLHAEWDRVLVDDAIRAERGGVAGLASIAAYSVASRGWHSVAAESWAQESWGIGRTSTYPATLQRTFCHDAGTIVELDIAYRQVAVSTVAEQLEKAGVRLADVLNANLASGR